MLSMILTYPFGLARKWVYVAEVAGEEFPHSTVSVIRPPLDYFYLISYYLKLTLCLSGKTSLTLALFRMLELSSGSMTIDGQKLTLMPRATIRSRLNAVPKEPFFLPGSIRLNLDPYGTSTDLQIQLVLQKVGLLGALKLEGAGLHAQLSPETMSQGQRQLFCLARAILRRGAVVILDEAASGVDATTADTVTSLIREEFKGKTVLAIAHRLGMIADFDRVVVMSEGRVVEVGEPRKLLEDGKSAFRELWERSGRDVEQKRVAE